MLPPFSRHEAEGWLLFSSCGTNRWRAVFQFGGRKKGSELLIDNKMAALHRS
jgi:hypothetical protein